MRASAKAVTIHDLRFTIYYLRSAIYYKEMMRKFLIAGGVIGIFVVSAAAQAKTVTNADLAKFAEKRINAEREYRENYERLGLPSPEELEKRNAEEAAEREELVRRLRADRLRSEAIEAQLRVAESLNQPTVVYSSPQYSNGGYHQTYPYFYGGGISYGHRPIKRVNDPVFNRFRGDRNRSYYPWMIIRTPTITPNFGGFPRRR